MRSVTYLILFVIVSVSSTTYRFGEKTATSKLVKREKVFLEAIPWKKRVTIYEFNGPPDLRIKAIYCYDYQNSEASVNITEGGLGTNRFTLRMKTQRSYRLDYTIEVYQ